MLALRRPDRDRDGYEALARPVEGAVVPLSEASPGRSLRRL